MQSWREYSNPRVEKGSGLLPSTEIHDLIPLTELPKLQKIGQFPDEPRYLYY
jgi:hypothetical protein